MGTITSCFFFSQVTERDSRKGSFPEARARARVRAAPPYANSAACPIVQLELGPPSPAAARVVFPARAMPGPKETTFSDIPAELRRLAVQGGASASRFSVCAMRLGGDGAMPLTGIGKEADLVVRGMVCGGTLYIKHVYSLKDDERVMQFDPNKPHQEVRTVSARNGPADTVGTIHCIATRTGR